MAHLPNEIWLQILAYVPHEDVWRSARPVNRQLCVCGEQVIKDEWLPQVLLSLSISLPTYDMRNPIRGHVGFCPVNEPSPPSMASDEDTKAFVLLKTEPQHYRDHFLSRWKGMRTSGNGRLDDQKQWQLSFHESIVSVRLKEPTIEYAEYIDEETAWLSCDWKALATGFFKHYPPQMDM